MRTIGKFHNPEGRAVRVYVGNDCHNGKGVRFWFDGRGKRHFIDDRKFRAWKAAKPKT
jgi:hypothetical protein